MNPAVAIEAPEVDVKLDPCNAFKAKIVAPSLHCESGSPQDPGDPGDPTELIPDDLPGGLDVFDIVGIHWCSTTTPLTGDWVDEVSTPALAYGVPSVGKGEGSIKYTNGGNQAVGGSATGAGAFGRVTVAFSPDGSSKATYTFAGVAIPQAEGGLDTICEDKDGKPWTLAQRMTGMTIHATGSLPGSVGLRSEGRLGSVV